MPTKTARVKSRDLVQTSGRYPRCDNLNMDNNNCNVVTDNLNTLNPKIIEVCSELRCLYYTALLQVSPDLSICMTSK